MSSFVKNHKRFFSSLLALLLNSSLHAITFRNQPISNGIQLGDILCTRVAENSFVVLEIENDNFDIRYDDIEKLDNLEEIFQKAMAGRGGSISSRICNLSSNTIDYNSSRLVARESLNIQARTFLQLTHCFLESPLISIVGNKMNFADSFLINPEVLNIRIDSSNSDYDIIQILFYNQTEKPTIITGEIDLQNNKAKKKLFISNVKEVRMQFMSNKN